MDATRGLLVGVVVLAASCNCGDRAKDARASALVAAAVSETTRDAAAEALGCPPFVERSAIRAALSRRDVAGCSPVGTIAAFNERVWLEEGVWWAYVHCKDGSQLFFSLVPVHGRTCGATSSGFFVERISVHDKDPHIVFDVAPDVKDKIARAEAK